MTEATVKDMLGALYAAKIAKTAGIAVLIVVGALLAALGIFFVFKAKKIRRLEALGIADAKLYNKLDENSINGR